MIPTLDTLLSVSSAARSKRIIPEKGITEELISMGVDTNTKVMDALTDLSETLTNEAIVSSLTISQREELAKKTLVQVGRRSQEGPSIYC